MAEDNADLGKFFAENKATTMKAGKNAKATEGRKSIPKNTKGKAVLTSVKYYEKDGKMRRYVFLGNAVTPAEFKGYNVSPTFWMDPGPKGDKTNQDLIEEFIGALMAVAGGLADKVRDTFASGKTGEINKLVASIVKAKPVFAYSTWGDKNVNFNFDGVPEEGDGESSSDDGDGDSADGTDVDDNADAGDDYNTEDGDGDASAEDDGDGEETVEDDGPGFAVDDVVTFKHSKEGALKVKVLDINTDKGTVKVKEIKGQKRSFEGPFSKIEA